MITAPYPEVDDLLEMIGETGHRLANIDASEGAAGNISIYAGWHFEPRSRFPLSAPMELPQPVPELAGSSFLVTGSGRRREIIDEPLANIGCIVVDEGGKTGTLFTSHHRRFERVTSEFNSHLAVHYDQVLKTGTNFHALVHAQPPHLTYLSHVERYRDEKYLNTHLLRWQPETIITLPEGIGMVPFCVPGSAELMRRTVESLQKHRVVVWAKHGAMARSDVSVKRAGDRIEYAEAAAKYEYLNLAAGAIGTGLSVEEILSICKDLDIQQDIF
ncbi:MAG: class II aldolase/adducin family protein [Chloroflexota bacterium]